MQGITYGINSIFYSFVGHKMVWDSLRFINCKLLKSYLTHKRALYVEPDCFVHILDMLSLNWFPIFL